MSVHEVKGLGRIVFVVQIFT